MTPTADDPSASPTQHTQSGDESVALEQGHFVGDAIPLGVDA